MKKSFAQIAWMAAMTLTFAACSVGGGEDGYYLAICPDGSNGYGGTQEPQAGGDKFKDFTDNPFVQTSQQPASTFSVDADGASFCIVRRYLNDGFHVDKASVRIEELLNYFTFDYAEPTDGHSVAINAELGPCLWNEEHAMLRLGLKGKSLSEKEIPLANYVFLIDVSGSMYSQDKLPLLKSGLQTLLHQLQPDDRISIVTYSGEVKKLLESTPVREIDKISRAISQLNASGSTAGGEAIKMAYEEALANYDEKRNNRVIMGTDGDFNVGVTSTEALTEMVEDYARKGIYMTCLGFGLGNLNDAMMEEISNKGNGTYHYIDSEDEMMKVFVHERERFISVANDVKCQVTFDSTLVSSYRLIGYENRVMSNQDFENDEKDAGEIGAGQTITALYELVPTQKWKETAAIANADEMPSPVTFDCRYKKALGEESQSLTCQARYETILGINGPILSVSENMRFAQGVAAFGMVLRESPYKGSATIDMARQLVSSSTSFDPHGYRAGLLQMMTEQTTNGSRQ